jgi:hypothetical protein
MNICILAPLVWVIDTLFNAPDTINASRNNLSSLGGHDEPPPVSYRTIWAVATLDTIVLLLQAQAAGSIRYHHTLAPIVIYF